jgi:hypothetical protein
MRLKVFYGKRTFWLEEDASIFLHKKTSIENFKIQLRFFYFIMIRQRNAMK